MTPECHRNRFVTTPQILCLINKEGREKERGEGKKREQKIHHLRQILT